MSIIYKTKWKTQGNLREIMTEDYKKNWKSIFIWEKWNH
jgi:hypothetical protein